MWVAIAFLALWAAAVLVVCFTLDRRCPSCRAFISRRASGCPFCGAPVDTRSGRGPGRHGPFDL